MPAFRVATGVTENLDSAEEILAKGGAELISVPMRTEEDIIKYAADTDGVIVGAREPYTRKVIRAMAKCKIISRMGIGFNNIDVEEATAQGIPVAIILDASLHEVSDHTLLLILALARKLYSLQKVAREGAWTSEMREMAKAREKIIRLNHQTLGLVGMGKIGGLVAQKAAVFGFRILVYDPYISSEILRGTDSVRVEFDTLLKESDYISLHAPLTSDTRHLFGMEEFRKMKPTAYIINTSRGGLVDEKALYQAIIEGRIAGAGLDVTDPEPPGPDNPLLKLDQVLVTGHSAWFSETSVMELRQKAAEAILMALKGIFPPSLANPDVRQQKNCRVIREN
jgi:D-3-phosphoglycerate dehydrogenase